MTVRHRVDRSRGGEGAHAAAHADARRRRRCSSAAHPLPELTPRVTWLHQSPASVMAKAVFVPPVVQENETGWGPCRIPDKYSELPYQPFSKSDRIGKVCPSVSCYALGLLTCHVAGHRSLTGPVRRTATSAWPTSTTRSSAAAASMPTTRTTKRGRTSWWTLAEAGLA